jgi:hypothetical protein
VSAARGVTLFQLLGGVLAIGIVFTIVTRVYGSAEDTAPETSLGKLRHLHRAIALYRSEYGDGGITEGLPDRDYVYDTYLGYSREYFISPCAGRRGFASRAEGVSYAYTWTPLRQQVFESMGLKTPIFVDMDCTPVTRNGQPNLGLAVLLDGTAISLRKHGNPNSLAWWTEDQR